MKIILYGAKLMAISRSKGTRHKRVRTLNLSKLPSEEGVYYWSEWKAYFQVRKIGKYFYIAPPKSPALRITPFIVGKFELQTSIIDSDKIYACPDLEKK